MVNNPRTSKGKLTPPKSTLTAPLEMQVRFVRLSGETGVQTYYTTSVK